MSEPYMSVAWTDADTGARGYVVIDALIRGLAGGGLRMRRGCTLAEVGDLARAMSRKEAIAFRPGARYLPLGGAKGGIDFDPDDPRARGVLRRYLEAMLPLLQSRWAAGEDLGVRQDELDELAAELGLRSTVDAVLPYVEDGAAAGLARLAAAFAAGDRGIGLGELVGGYGVARAALAGLRALGRDPGSCTAVVQGFGSMGGATARYLTDAGVRVIGVADARGVVFDEAGLDVERLLATRDRLGRIDRSAVSGGGRELPLESWAGLSCDLLLPAATSYVIDAAVADRIRAALVVEAANVATVADAESRLAARSIPVVPDFIANLATNAWWWWTLFGDIEPTLEDAFAMIDDTISGLVHEVFDRGAGSGEPLRAVAIQMADERAAAAARATRTLETGDGQARVGASA
jgi:glutamate dehydrogenase (NAD(P)+)